MHGIAESKVSPCVRDLLLSIVDSSRNGDEIIAVNSDEFLTPNEAAKRIGMSRTHLYKLLDSGEIPSDRVGKHRRIRFHDLIKFEKERDKDRLELAEQFARRRETAISADREIAELL
ncbi:hypothetical protein CPHO_00375 [Corynebacterium phocae]|uniref:Helix-turn-helix domain-containing protein n=1 Tax=Corynebacterium phocae TaxID=161895 RepID=A0A1L7D6E9_9CORY|nr:hypothetical protein CPHO_00375 [Corynebacterium phocae]